MQKILNNGSRLTRSLVRPFGGMMGMGSSDTAADTRLELWKTENRSGILLTLDDTQGALASTLNILSKHNVDLTQIHSKPPKVSGDRKTMNFHVDIVGELHHPHIKNAIDELRKNAVGITEVGSHEVPWFPTRIEDFDFIGKRVLSEGDGIQDADHPGFRDEVYKKRRNEITQIAMDYKVGEAIPRLTYTQTEKDVWKFCYDGLKDLFKTNACQEFNWTINEFEKEVGFRNDEIPQLEDISQFLQNRTGWRLKPVGGLLTQREFLNGLAFKVFHSTQYIRHHSAPLYTPEPDIVHELMGHAPMFAHKDFSDFSQSIGLASLGASELEIKRLASIYWFTIEFGMCMENSKPKAYGAGILSSVGELDYCVGDKPTHYRLDPYEIAQNHLDINISSMQEYYFVAESFETAKQQITDYCEAISKPFSVSYNEQSHTVDVDRKIQTRHEIEDGPLF